MKRWIGCIGFAIFVLLNNFAFAKNALGPGYPIYYAHGLTIDGDVTDWSHAEWVTYSSSTVAKTGGTSWGTPDNSCSFAMMYDNEALYCAAKVTDDLLSFNDSTEAYQFWTRDGVMWYLDFTDNDEQDVLLWPDYWQDYENANNQKWLPGEMIIGIGATADQTSDKTRLWAVGTRNGNRSDNADKTLTDGTVVRGEINEQWQSVVVINGSNYTVEVKVPWESLKRSQYYSDPEGVDPSNPDYTGGLTPEELDLLGWNPMLPSPLAGSKIGFTHLWIDCDLPAGGYESQVMWVGDGDIDARWTEATFSEDTPVPSWELFE